MMNKSLSLSPLSTQVDIVPANGSTESAVCANVLNTTERRNTDQTW